LREKIVLKLRNLNHIDASVETVTVTPGGTFGYAAAAMAITVPGEDILIPTPGYPTFEQVVALHGGIPRYFPLDSRNGFLPDTEQLEALITNRTRAVVINSPANPTGAVLPRRLVEDIVAFAHRHDLYIISDEVYESIVFEGNHTSPASLDEDGRVISVFSFSKTYAMTGWRIGYVMASPTISALIRRFLEPYTGAASSVSQKAAEAALDGDQTCVRMMVDSYHHRRDAAMALLEKEGLKASHPSGAFYLFVDVSSCPMDSNAFALRLLEEKQVAVRPGDLFGPGGSGHVRLSFAARRDVIEEGITRMGEFVRGHAGSAV
jgi:aspartate aminotransferase/aminotransferase